MAYYREVYANSTRWNGDDALEGKKVIIYGEAGDGDMLQFARYVPLLTKRGCDVIFHCPKRLHRLFRQLGIDLLDIEETELPDHDYHICSMSLPFVLNQADAKVPYLKAGKMDLDVPGTKIAIAWEGNPEHSNADERNCPLHHFKKLVAPDRSFLMAQKKIHSVDLLEGAEDFDLFGVPIDDYMDTADLLNSVDAVVCVDTSVAHVAGAIGKRTFLLLSYRCDPRWEVKQWYNDITIVRQNKPGDWATVMNTVVDLL
jgi:hypothetical protein